MKNYREKGEWYPTVDAELNKKYKNQKYIKKYINEQVKNSSIVINLFVLEIIINNFTSGSKDSLDGIIKIFYTNFKDHNDISIFFKKIMKVDDIYNKKITLTEEVIREYLDVNNAMPLEWILMLGDESNKMEVTPVE